MHAIGAAPRSLRAPAPTHRRPRHRGAIGVPANQRAVHCAYSSARVIVAKTQAGSRRHPRATRTELGAGTPLRRAECALQCTLDDGAARQLTPGVVRESITYLQPARRPLARKTRRAGVARHTFCLLPLLNAHVPGPSEFGCAPALRQFTRAQCLHVSRINGDRPESSPRAPRPAETHAVLQWTSGRGTRSARA